MGDRLEDRDYFRVYRNALGFTNQQQAKEFLSGKSVAAGIDFDYIDRLLARLNEIMSVVNTSLHPSLRSEPVNYLHELH